MIIQDKYSNSRKMRIWIDEVPNIECNSIDSIVDSRCEQKNIVWHQNILVLEVVFGICEASLYALLGVKYSKSDSKALLVEVKVSDYEGKRVEDNIGICDEIVGGIPREYGEEIVKLLNEKIDRIGCPGGKIEIFVGAHGYIGSSRMTFRKAADILIDLISSPNTLNEIEIKRIIIDGMNKLTS